MRNMVQSHIPFVKPCKSTLPYVKQLYRKMSLTEVTNYRIFMLGDIEAKMRQIKKMFSFQFILVFMNKITLGYYIYGK